MRPRRAFTLVELLVVIALQYEAREEPVTHDATTVVGSELKLSSSGSTTEVIRRALAVYEHLWKAKQGKTQIVIADENGEESDLLLL